MKIILNKKEVELTENTTVAIILKNQEAKRAAVWVNGKQLLSAEYASYVLQSEDHVKILRVVAGG